MFKNIITYAIPSKWSPDLMLVEEALTRSKFVECGTSQEKSIGWVGTPWRKERSSARIRGRSVALEVANRDQDSL